MQSDRYRQAWHLWGRLCRTLITIWGVLVFGCAWQGLEPIGSWVSSEVTHPSPFLSEPLNRDKHRNFVLLFDRNGGFVWRDSAGHCHMGKYLVQNRTINLTDSQEGMITLVYSQRGDRLFLQSPDGFAFEFRRAPGSADEGVKSCNPQDGDEDGSRRGSGATNQNS